MIAEAVRVHEDEREGERKINTSRAGFNRALFIRAKFRRAGLACWHQTHITNIRESEKILEHA